MSSVPANTPRRFRVFAMDTAFQTPIGAYPLQLRWEMVKSLGFDAAYYVLWNAHERDELAKIGAVSRQVGIPCAGVWVWMTLSDGPRPCNDSAIVEALKVMPPGYALELTIGSVANVSDRSDPAGDLTVLRVLEQCLDVADRNDLRILLYPHINCWMEKHDDALRLTRQLQHPRLGLVFSAFHWFALQNTGLPSLLAAMMPRLGSVNLCGTRRVSSGNPTIETVDEGTLDHFAILGLLRRLNYSGAVGVQGFSVGGDPYAKLRRSLTAIRDIEARLDAHPDWAARIDFAQS